VQYKKRLVGGSFANAGLPVSTPPYTVNLGTLAAGTYEIQATVGDSHVPVRSNDSPIRTITVAPPAIIVDKQYTWNDNAEEPGLPRYFQSGSDEPTYANGQVTLPPGTYLKGTGLYSLQPTEFGMEVIMSQVSDTPGSRWIRISD
jgi:hypothetical protein